MRLALLARSSVQSLGFERSRFPEMRDEWEPNLLKCMGPHMRFDRLPAPIENRYTTAEVEARLASAGLEDVVVYPNCGWVATGRKSASTLASPNPLGQLVNPARKKRMYYPGKKVSHPYTLRGH